MKNILTAVFLLGFLGTSTALFARHLSVIESSRPCNINTKHTLYLEADPNACYGNSIQVTSPNWRATPIDIGNGAGFAASVPLTVSPTGWAYAIEVQSHNRMRNINVRELVYTPNCMYSSYTTNITISPRVRLAPDLTDIGLISTSLCVGTLLAEAKDDNKTSVSTYSWTYQGSPIASNAVQGYLLKSAGTAINTDFTLGVTANNGCVSRSYSKTFDVYPLVASSEPRLVFPTQYCSGTRNEFSLANPIPGIEYRWEFTAQMPSTLHPSIASQGPYQSLDMTTFSPDFGTNPIVDQGLVTSYTITVWYRGWDCDWKYLDSRSVNVTYSPYCSGGGSNRIAADNTFSTLDSKEDVLTAFPNPTTGVVNLDSEGEEIEAVKVYNVAGVLVTQKLNISDSNPSIDLSKFPKGMYMVNIQTATTNKTVQVIKE